MQLAQSLSALAASGGPGAAPIVVRNTLPGIVTFTDDNTRLVVTWAGSGDAHGGDIKEVAPALLANPQFREQVLRGIFAIEQSDDVLQAALDLQRAHWQSRQLQSANAIAEIEQSNDTVIAVGQPCIAPKGRALCGSYANVTGKDLASEPPLCVDHKVLAAQYEKNETGRVIDGKPEVVWRRATPARV